MHNGGAYGDGTTQIGVGFGFGAARTAGKLGQLTFSSGRPSASSQDYFVERLWEERPRDCPATGDEQEHGRPVATTVPGTGRVRTLRGVTPRPSPPDKRLASCPIVSQDAEVETQSRNALECPSDCRRERSIEIDGAPHLAGVWLAAASTKTFQAFERSIFCRKSTGYCRAVLESP